MRVLIRFPIIHGSEDMGKLDKAVNKGRTAEDALKQQAVVKYFWTTIENAINDFGLDFSKVKVYQDSLPVCGKESEIVDDTAKTGSYNYLLLQTLRDKGATIMGTESPEFLLEEYALMKRVYQPKLGQVPPNPQLAQSLLDRRDEFIARRIEETLYDEEIGLLFLGLNHRIEGRLPKDISLIQPLGELKPR
jgi:hypothetical protein